MNRESIARAMTRDLLTASADDRLTDAARRMAERRVGAMLVTDGRRLDGILTERDVLRAVGGSSIEGTVADWMTRDPDTLSSSGTVGEAASLMAHGGYRHLPIVDGEELVGIVSIRDLVRVQSDSPLGV